MKHSISTQMTKKALADSLKKFMSIKPISKISVREVVEACGFNRQTFYYHFQDIYDLVEWMFAQETIELIKKYDSVLTYEDAMRYTFNYVKENKHICNCALDSLGRDHIRRFFYKDLEGMVNNIVIELSKGLVIEKSYIQFITAFYTRALAGTLLDWLNDDMKDDIDMMIKYITCTLSGNIKAALERADQSIK